MKILTYNFVQPGDVEGKGGGVAVYQANLVQALTRAGHQVVSMSSGDRYSPWRADPFLAFSTDTAGHTPALERVVVVNSPVFAPAHSAFYGIAAYSDDPGLDAVPAALRARYGSIDVFHFQNLEGLTAGFFRALRAEFPGAVILLSAHNYNLICPQVNLWFREHRVCQDFRDGRACVNCLLSRDRHRFERNIRRMNALLAQLRVPRRGPTLRLARWLIRAPLRLRRQLLARLNRAEAKTPVPPLALIGDTAAAAYARYRSTNLDLVRTVFDRVLAVSERTRDVLIAQDVPAESVAVSYIGTAHHAHFARAPRQLRVSDHLHIGYLGYMRADKGFYFLLDGLESMPDAWARDLAVTIAAPITDHHALERLRAVGHRFRQITVHDGFTHATLDRVLDRVQLGIVPVLWEDNLPQVAIEFVSRGIPVLTSDRGGAQEIGNNPAFRFTAGHRAQFRAKVRDIAVGRLPLARFWDQPPRIFSMEQHVAGLMAHYARARSPAHVDP